MIITGEQLKVVAEIKRYDTTRSDSVTTQLLPAVTVLPALTVLPAVAELSARAATSSDCTTSSDWLPAENVLPAVTVPPAVTWSVTWVVGDNAADTVNLGSSW